MAKEWAPSSPSPVSEQKAAVGPRDGGTLTHEASERGEKTAGPQVCLQRGALPTPAPQSKPGPGVRPLQQPEGRCLWQLGRGARVGGIGERRHSWHTAGAGTGSTQAPKAKWEAVMVGRGRPF